MIARSSFCFYSFEYDKLGWMKSARSFLYNQLTAAVGPLYGRFDEILEYDLNGNIKTISRGSEGQHLSFIEVTSISAIKFSYDPNGNWRTSGGNTQFKYNYLNLCEEVSNFGGALYMHQSYSSDGAKRTMKGRNYTLDYLGSLIYRTVSGTMALDVARFEEGVLRANGETNYFIKDHLGSVRVIVNAAGEVLEQNDFYPFGKRQPRATQKMSGTNQFLFGGKEALEGYIGWGTPGIGSYDFGARIYYSEFGRFDGPDPLSEKYYSISPYAYCMNNPVRYVDPDGRKIVDANGNLMWNNGGWTQYATADAIRVGNALTSTKTGIQQFNKLVDHPAEVQLEINQTDYPDKRGQMKGMLTGDLITGNAKVTSGIITLFESRIEEFAKEVNITVDESLAGTAGHEIEHLTNENATQKFQNGIFGTNHDIEAKPNEIKNSIVREFKSQRPIPGQDLIQKDLRIIPYEKLNR